MGTDIRTLLAPAGEFEVDQVFYFFGRRYRVIQASGTSYVCEVEQLASHESTREQHALLMKAMKLRFDQVCFGRRWR